MTTTLATILAILCGYVLVTNILSKDKARIWEPMTFVSLTYIYYCLMPVVMKDSRYSLSNDSSAAAMMQAGSLISYICILYGCRKFRTKDLKWNKFITTGNAYKTGLILFLVALCMYVPFRGFHLNPVDTGQEYNFASSSLEWYCIEAMDFFCMAAGLIFVGIKSDKKNLWALLPLWIIIATYLFAGARWRLIAFTMCLCPVYYMYPKIKRVNYPIMAVLMIAMYLFFAVMDQARQRSKGINMDAARDITMEEASKGAAENYSVYWFSGLTMEVVEKKQEYIYLEPVWNAVCMPIPRQLFPWKPNAEYIHRMEVIAGDEGGGAAYLFFAEAFASFWWFGLIAYSLAFGWLCAVFWNNFDRHRSSIGAIVALGLFNGFSYCFISRGYMAASFTLIFYLIYIPFWISKYIIKKTDRHRQYSRI